MVLARVAEYLSPSDTISHHASTETAAQRDHRGKIVQQDSAMEEEARPPYIHVSLDHDTAAGPRLTEFRQCLQEVLVV